MIKAELSTVINRSVEEVFKYVAMGFFENYSKWEPTVLELEKTSQDPVGVGTTGRQVMNVNSERRLAESTFRVTNYDPNRKFSVTSTGKPYFKTSYTFEPVDSSTKVTYAFEFGIDGVAKLFEPLIAGSVNKGSQDAVDNLKKLLEFKA